MGPPDRELEELLRIARSAAVVVRAVYATAFEVELKGPNDPVTRADREANELICRALEASFPGDAILAEESAPTDPAELARLAKRERIFYVDPLDGTREFADRNEEFAVMIGLAVQGRAMAGVVVEPTLGDALVARAAGPAFLEDAKGARRPLEVSACSDPKRARLVVSRSHRPRVVQPVVDALGITTLIPCGSVGVKVGRLATGRAELYVHGGRGAKKWDTCAPEAILAGAGGRFTDLAGASIDYARPGIAQEGGILASNGALHDAVLAALRCSPKN